MIKYSPILIDCPFPIETKRLKIRPMMPYDGKQVFEAICQSRAQFEEWFHWADEVKSWKDSEVTARKFYAQFILREAFHFVFLKDGVVIGSCGYHDIDWLIPSGSIGYWCRTDYQGKGYTKEAVAAITLYGFQHMGLRRVDILCDDENIKSCALAESLGFHMELKSQGIISKPKDNNLRQGRRYVRFNTQGLEEWKTQW